MSQPELPDKFRVHIAPLLEVSQRAALDPLLDPLIVITRGDEPPEPADYEVLVSGRRREARLDASPRLRRVVVPFAGVPDATRQRLLDRPSLSLHNLHHNAAPTAEMAVALLLAAAKAVVPADRSLRADDWSPRYGEQRAVLLEGKTALVLGFGAVGQRVARMCQGLGMHVAAVRRHPERGGPDPSVDVHSPSVLPDLLTRANALIICLPHSDETHGLIGQRELGLLPADAVLVNIARGPVVDEAALYEALVQRRLHAAGLDVWWNYPGQADGHHAAPSRFAFNTLDNVVMSPHRAGHVRETEALRMAHLADLLNAAARGGPVPNLVDPAAGY